MTFEVKLPSACSFIVDGLAFCCRCSHYMFRPNLKRSVKFVVERLTHYCHKASKRNESDTQALLTSASHVEASRLRILGPAAMRALLPAKSARRPTHRPALCLSRQRQVLSFTGLGDDDYKTCDNDEDQRCPWLPLEENETKSRQHLFVVRQERTCLSCRSRGSFSWCYLNAALVYNY
jgi:Fe-S-cluster containining protein